jgi:hypothetical protein
LIPASATVVVPLAASLMMQAHTFDLAAEQQRARDEAASDAHTLKVADDKRRREERAAREAERKRVKRSAPAPAGSPKDIARSLVSASQWPCLNSLWQRESGWRWNARNASSGAYGIPQALPGSKMSSDGSDWRTNPTTQIRWGLSYIKSRYGSPCGAWGHSQKVGWY